MAKDELQNEIVFTNIACMKHTLGARLDVVKTQNTSDIQVKHIARRFGISGAASIMMTTAANTTTIINRTVRYGVQLETKIVYIRSISFFFLTLH